MRSYGSSNRERKRRMRTAALSDSSIMINKEEYNMSDDMNMGGSTMWFLALMLLLFGGFGGGYGARGPVPMGPQYATVEQVQEGFNNQAVQAQLSQIALSSANNNYETANLLNQQTNRLEQSNQTNLINAIQGFNQVQGAIANQTNVLQAQLMQLGEQLNQCCCSIKTQMLQDKYEAVQAQLTQARDEISNYNQSQYLLGQMGRYVAWAGSGTQTQG